jgi:hypothetical protein
MLTPEQKAMTKRISAPRMILFIITTVFLACFQLGGPDAVAVIPLVPGQSGQIT